MHTRNRRTVWICAALFFSWLTSNPSARAQMVDCPAIRHVSSYKVVIDDVLYSSSALQTDADLRLLMDRLRFTVNNQLTELALEMRSAIPLSVIPCPGRHPAGESDFDRDRSRDLADSKVVLEVWGTLDGKLQRGKVAGHEARIGYAVLPLRFYEFGVVDLPGVYVLHYPRSATASRSDSAAVVEQLPELNAFATLGVGLKAAKAREYDLAVQYLKKAEILLGAALIDGSPLYARLKQALLAFVHRRTCETITAALAYPAYQGGLRLVYATRPPCQ